jgi:hypothetical protein
MISLLQHVMRTTNAQKRIHVVLTRVHVVQALTVWVHVILNSRSIQHHVCQLQCVSQDLTLQELLIWWSKSNI